MLISTMGVEASGAAYFVSVMRHCARCLVLRHSADLASKSASTASEKVAGRCSAIRRSTIGSRPSRRVRRALCASSRASPRVTRRTGPSPISRRLPPFCETKTQRRIPFEVHAQIKSVAIGPEPRACLQHRGRVKSFGNAPFLLRHIRPPYSLSYGL